LRLLHVLGRELNLSRCAERMHISQPATSRGLQEIEGIVGVSLFDRTTHAVKPTALGINLIWHASNAVQLLSQQAPQVEIRLHEGLAYELICELGDSVTDLMLGHLNVLEPPQELNVDVLFTESVGILVSRKHRFVRRSMINHEKHGRRALGIAAAKHDHQENNRSKIPLLGMSLIGQCLERLAGRAGVVPDIE